MMVHIFWNCVLLLVFNFKKKEIPTTILVVLILWWETTHLTVFLFFWGGGNKNTRYYKCDCLSININSNNLFLLKRSRFAQDFPRKSSKKNLYLGNVLEFHTSLSWGSCKIVLACPQLFLNFGFQNAMVTL